MAVFGIGSAAANFLTGGKASSLSVNVSKPMALPRSGTDPASLVYRSGQVAAASVAPGVVVTPGFNAGGQNIVGGGGSGVTQTPVAKAVAQPGQGVQPIAMPVQVTSPITGGPAYVPVPPPVAQAIQGGDPNAAAAVNAAYGGPSGGGASPSPISAANVSSGVDDVWGPRLFGLGILVAAAGVLFVAGKAVK